MKVTCASVLKPVYAWLCPDSPDRWVLAAAAITTSDNAAASKLAARIGTLTFLG